MKISQPILILSSAGLGLMLVYCEQGSNDTASKAQQILRQKIAELDNAKALPSKDQLLADVERLHQEGKISDQQFETFKKNIREQYVAPEGTANPESQARTQQLLEQKIGELNAGQQAVLPPANPEVQAKAEKALEQNLNQSQAAPPPHPETGTVAEQVLHQRISQLRTDEKSNIVPEKAGATLTPEAEAKARELLRLKIAEARKADLTQPRPNPEAQAKALTVLHQSDAEVQAGVTPDTPEATRLLRLKIAESKGTISPQEAAKAAATPAQSTALAATPAAAPQTTPAIGTAPVTFQTSNKTGLARLNELTELYKADKVTPYDYHHERAKIVATL